MEISEICDIRMNGETFSRIYQLPRSERRRLSAIFDPFISQSEARDDTLFYDAVLMQLRENPAFARSLDSAFPASKARKVGKEIKRQFSLQALHWLHKAVAPELARSEMSKLLFSDRDHFAKSFISRPDAKEIYGFLLAAITPDRELVDASSAEHTTAPVPEVWTELRDRIGAALAQMLKPDVGDAQAIFADARKLLELCEFEAERDNELEARREALSEKFERLTEELDTEALHELIEFIGDDDIDDAEAVTDELLSLAECFNSANAERSRLQAVYDAAVRTPTERAALRLAMDAIDGAEAAVELALNVLEDAIKGYVALYEGTVDMGEDDALPPAGQIAQPAPIELDVAGSEQNFQLPAQEAAPIPEETLPAAASPRFAEEPAPANPALAQDLELSPSQLETQDDLQIEAEAPSPEDGPAIWGGALPLDDIIAAHLQASEKVFAWRLCKLAEARNFPTALPAVALKALASVAAVVGPTESSIWQITETLADAMSVVDELDATGDEKRSARARAVVFAALLRPALLVPDSSAREHLQNLSMRGALVPLAGLQNALAQLPREVRPSIWDLAAIAGADRRQRRTQAAADLWTWLEHARNAQSLHAPTSDILHGLVAPTGRFGLAMGAALDRTSGGVAAAEVLIAEFLEDRSALERLIVDQEREVGRPRGDKIMGMALTWICRKLQEGCLALQGLLEAQAADDAASMDDRSRIALKRAVGLLEKALGAIDRPSLGDRDIDLAIEGAVQESLDDFAALLRGQGGSNSAPRLSEVLEAPLLRLPGLAQRFTPRDDHGRFAAEIEAQERALFETLQLPDAASCDERTAFDARCAEGALIPARQLLHRLMSGGKIDAAEIAAMEQQIQESATAARGQVRARIDRLRLDLVTLMNLDLESGASIQAQLDRLSEIERALETGADPQAQGVSIPALGGERSVDVPPDFPHLAQFLEACEAERGALRQRIRAAHRQQLEELSSEGRPQAASARTLLDTIEHRDPITIEEFIAQLRDGLPLEQAESERRDAFAAFYPDFVAAVAATPTELLKIEAINAALADRSAAGPLDFSGLEDGMRSAAHQMLQSWRRLSNAMSRPAGNVGEPLREVMESLGFTSVVTDGDRILVQGKLRRVRVRCDAPVAKRWFVPPVFGSEAAGEYQIVLVKRDVPVDQIADELGQIGRDQACVVCLFDRASVATRQAFARRMRRDKQTALLIDETQLLHLATLDGDRMERLFACALPFGYVQPYTTSPGKIPREMFFGRRSEIDKIVSLSSDGCLVYGGRQLGKSALLNQIRKIHHDASENRLAFHIVIDRIAISGRPAELIWDEIASALETDGVAPKRLMGADAVLSAIRKWLERHPSGRILMMLDEADMFLASEARTGFPNLGLLKDLMEATERKFKVVFAGLHNIRRLAKAANSPLVHLGDPICIGPLNTSVVSGREARRLVTAPMRAAGFDYADEGFASDILARVGYYPSLVQVFCKGLLEGLAGQSRLPGEGPRWKLSREQIFEGVSAQDIARQIRERFQWTLNLDPRYEVIAKSLALHRLAEENGHADVLRNGLTAEKVFEYAAIWWPHGLEQLDQDDFRAFLDEMVDLGVLARYGADKRRYGLRSAQVAQLLGREEELVEQILHISEREPRVDYDAATFHARVNPADVRRRSPISDTVLAGLFDGEKPGVKVLAAAPDVHGSDIAERLKEIGDGWRTRSGEPLDVVIHEGPAKGLPSTFDKKLRGRRIVIVSQRSGWTSEALRWCARHDAVRDGRIVAVMLGGPETMAQRRRIIDGDAMDGTDLITLRPWSESMLRAWLDEQEMGALSARRLRRVVLEGSGGAPLKLGNARETLMEIAGHGSDVETRLESWAAGQSLSPAQVGIPPALHECFANMAELLGVKIAKDDGVESIAAAELAGLLDDLLAETGFDLASALGLFGDLGLRMPGDPRTQPIALSPLGRLVGRYSAKP